MRLIVGSLGIGSLGIGSWDLGILGFWELINYEL